MQNSPLDNPVRASLFSLHAQFSLGGAQARRYHPDIQRFGATAGNDADCAAALASLLAPGDTVTLLQTESAVIDAALTRNLERPVLQLVAGVAIEREPSRFPIRPLAAEDADEMLALATLTKPGPFARSTWKMGAFVGVHQEGQLVAMAGERLRFPGHAEVSGVCTHPDFRGRGLARLLSCHVAARCQARGDVPFLHAWSDNVAAIRLYEALGFRLRSELLATVVARPAA